MAHPRDSHDRPATGSQPALYATPATAGREPAVGAVVVSYESHNVLGPLLASLAEHEPDVPVVVVDNASPSGPPEVTRWHDRTGGHAKLVVLPENRGYGTACNAGVESLSAGGITHLAFLNPDIRLIGPSLSELARLMNTRPSVGVASGPVVDETGQRVASAFGPTANLRALWFASGWQERRTRALIGRLIRRGMSASATLEDDLRVEGHVLGGAMMVTTACFAQIEGFDEEFFLYWEDADICERVRAAGAEVRILECTPFVHASTSATPGVDDVDRWQWYVEGARTFARKHLAAGQAHQLDAALQLGERLRAIRGSRTPRA